MYGSLMDIKRYEHMPYYFYPQGVKVVGMEDRIINLMDWMCDAHEEARNPHDSNKNFYQRSVFVWNNFARYSNPTVCNVMFDTQASRRAYDKLNSVASQQTYAFYVAASLVHGVAFTYMSYFFRYRRVGMLPILAVAVGYHQVFENVNSILYKMLIDQHVLNEARKLGLSQHAQPAGERKNRGFNYI